MLPPSPQWKPILSFLHTFPPKSACIRGRHPSMGEYPPQREILDPQLNMITMCCLT